MSVSGLCQVCESGPAQFTCELCGAVVCADHYDRAAGVCQQCASGAGAGGVQ